MEVGSRQTIISHAKSDNTNDYEMGVDNSVHDMGVPVALLVYHITLPRTFLKDLRNKNLY